MTDPSAASMTLLAGAQLSSPYPTAEPGTGASLVKRLIVGFCATALVLSALIVLAERPQWWRGLRAATIVSAIAAAASLVPLIWGFRQKLDRLVAAYFVAAGIRAAISLGGCLFAVFFGRYPGGPTLLMMVCYYAVLLSIETLMVAKVTWSAKL